MIRPRYQSNDTLEDLALTSSVSTKKRRNPPPLDDFSEFVKAAQEKRVLEVRGDSTPPGKYLRVGKAATFRDEEIHEDVKKEPKTKAEIEEEFYNNLTRLATATLEKSRKAYLGNSTFRKKANTYQEREGLKTQMSERNKPVTKVMTEQVNNGGENKSLRIIGFL